MNHHTFKDCCFCGSSIHLRLGMPHCSGDNLQSTQSIFDDILKLESEGEAFASKISALQDNECVFDLFMVYWNLKKKDPETRLECIHEDTYFRDLEPETQEIPMPPAHIPFSDLAEVYIAEIMLGRELTDLEKDGSRYIPKIDEEGNIYEAPLTWIKYPKDYMSTRKATNEILDLEPLPKIFDINEIRNCRKKDA